MAKEMEAKSKLIKEYLVIKKGVKFIVPEYQRAYSWSKDECDKLWEDIDAFRVLKNESPEELDAYFFGTIIVDYSQEDSEKEVCLIDGQQRTTTFLLLLKALQLAISDTLENLGKSEDYEKLKTRLERQKEEIIKIVYNANNDEVFEIQKDWNIVKNLPVILETRSIREKEKCRNDLLLVLCTSKYEKKEKGSNFFQNFNYFYEKFEDLDSTALKDFAEVILDYCRIVEIRSWQTNQAIEMFNSLNSKGTELSDADIISATLYSNLKKDEKEKFSENWKLIQEIVDEIGDEHIADINSVLQQYMYIQRAVAKEYLLENIEKNTTSVNVTTPGLRKWYLANKNILESPLELCFSLKKISDIWNWAKDIPVIKILLKFNGNLKLFLISYLSRFEINERTSRLDIEDSELTCISECFLRLFAIFELVDTGYSSSQFKSFLFEENLKLIDKKIRLPEIKNDFNGHIKKTWGSDENKKDIEKRLNKYDKNVLVYLNEYLYAKENEKEFVLDSKVNVEHIAPASGKNIGVIRKDVMGFDDKEGFNNIVNTLGNKILLEEKINKSLSNEWFRTKKQTSVKDKSGYNGSKFPIAFDLAKYKKDVWEKEDIENATKKAAARILKFIFGEANS